MYTKDIEQVFLFYDPFVGFIEAKYIEPEFGFSRYPHMIWWQSIVTLKWNFPICQF